jgi:hypothetical protein
MGRIYGGPTGEVSGKVGPVVFVKSKHGNFVRSGYTYNSKQSEAQRYQRTKMKATMAFLAPLKEVLRAAFIPDKPKRAAFQAANSYHLKEAMRFTEQGYVVDYPIALLSSGNLPVPENATQTLQPDNELLLQWADNSNRPLAKPTDHLMAVAFALESNNFIYQLHLANRQDTTALIPLPEDWTGQTVHVWVGFTQETPKRASSTVYLGVVGW